MANSVVNNSSAGLTSANQSALSGLNAASALVSVTSNNLVNASNPDYTVKQCAISTINLNGGTSAIQTSAVFRIVNESLIEDIRTLTSQSAYTNQLDFLYQKIQQNWSAPGHSALSTALQKFSQSVSNLANSPASANTQKQMVLDAQSLALVPGVIGQALQDMRTNCDQDIAQAVVEINLLLNEVKTLNQNILQSQGLSIADFQDSRDAALRKIAKYMDVNIYNQSSSTDLIGTVASNNLINIFAANGLPLLQNNFVNEIKFTPITVFDAGLQTPTPILINGTDISSSISGGSIAANTYMRDTILVNLQNDLDTLTQQLRDSINAAHNLGTGIPPAQTLIGQKVFSSGLASAFTGAGSVEIKLVDLKTGQFLESNTYDLTHATTLNDIISGLDNTAGGGHIQVQLNASHQLSLNSTSATAGIVINALNGLPTETITGRNLGFSHYFGLNDFFVTSGSTIADGQSIAGLTNVLKVRPDIIQMPSLISHQQIQPDMTTLFSGTSADTQSFAWSLSQALTSKTSFPASNNFTQRDESLGTYIAEIISYNSLLAKTNQDQNTIQHDHLTQTQLLHKDMSGVNSQEEIMKLLGYQRLFSVSSRILETVNKLFDLLTKLR